MKKDFISYKNQSAIRISDIAILDKNLDKNLDKDINFEEDYIIFFAFNKIVDGSSSIYGDTRTNWLFSTEQERDKVYNKILEIINTEIIT